jgi:hypothetical protein
MFNTPILFLIFNRPDATKRVFEQIRQIQPAHLYVAADAAREGRPDEAQRCAEARAVVNTMDWGGELKTLYRNQNLGCKIAVSEAITWFFENVEQGIILEDDCLPDPSFFPFCEELLHKYKDDARIGHIAGSMHAAGVIEEGLSYDFCSITHIWGWASWRRVWQNYDANFPFWNECKAKRSFLFCNKREEIYFTSFIPDVLGNKRHINTWDTQYYYTLRLQNQLSVYPAVNMITNIGLGDPNASHTSKKTGDGTPLSSMQFPLQHPKYVLKNKALDNQPLFFSWKRLLRYLLRRCKVRC